MTKGAMMGINIGNGNKIKNSNIAEKIEGDLSGGKRRFYEKHPWISGLAISFVVGFFYYFIFGKISLTGLRGGFNG